MHLRISRKTESRLQGSGATNGQISGARGIAPLKTHVQIIDSTRPGVPRSPLADARGYGSASSSPLVGQQAHGHSLAVAPRFRERAPLPSANVLREHQMGS